MKVLIEKKLYREEDTRNILTKIKTVVNDAFAKDFTYKFKLNDIDLNTGEEKEVDKELTYKIPFVVTVVKPTTYSSRFSLSVKRCEQMGIVSRDIAFLDEEIAAARDALESITFDLNGETIKAFDSIRFSAKNEAIPDNAPNAKPFKGSRREEANKSGKYNLYVDEIIVTCNDKDFSSGGIFDPKSLSNASQQSNIANADEKWRIADILRGGSRNKTPAKPRKKLFNSLADVIQEALQNVFSLSYFKDGKRCVVLEKQSSNGDVTYYLMFFVGGVDTFTATENNDDVEVSFTKRPNAKGITKIITKEDGKTLPKFNSLEDALDKAMKITNKVDESLEESFRLDEADDFYGTYDTVDDFSADGDYGLNNFKKLLNSYNSVVNNIEKLFPDMDTDIETSYGLYGGTYARDAANYESVYNDSEYSNYIWNDDEYLIDPDNLYVGDVISFKAIKETYQICDAFINEYQSKYVSLAKIGKRMLNGGSVELKELSTLLHTLAPLKSLLSKARLVSRGYKKITFKEESPYYPSNITMAIAKQFVNLDNSDVGVYQGGAGKATDQRYFDDKNIEKISVNDVDKYDAKLIDALLFTSKNVITTPSSDMTMFLSYCRALTILGVPLLESRTFCSNVELYFRLNDEYDKIFETIADWDGADIYDENSVVYSFLSNSSKNTNESLTEAEEITAEIGADMDEKVYVIKQFIRNLSEEDSEEESIVVAFRAETIDDALSQFEEARDEGFFIDTQSGDDVIKYSDTVEEMDESELPGEVYVYDSLDEYTSDLNEIDDSDKTASVDEDDYELSDIMSMEDEDDDVYDYEESYAYSNKVFDKMIETLRERR